MADIFLDTFTGTGTLATHIPELGGPWVDGTRALSKFVLDGAGAVGYTNTFEDSGEIAIPGSLPSGELGIEADVVIKREAPGESLGFVRFRSYDINFEAALFTLDGLTLWVALDTPGISTPQIDLGIPVVLNAVHNFRVEIDATRTQVVVLVDGVEVITETDPTPIPDPVQIWMNLSLRGASLPVNAFSLVRVYDDVTPEPAVIDCCPPLPQRTDPGCGDTSCGRAFKKKDIGWSDTLKVDGEYTFPESRLLPVETVKVGIPVGRETRHYRLTIGSALWAPLTIAAVEWTGQYFNNARRPG